jgi:hypothetical protein
MVEMTRQTVLDTVRPHYPQGFPPAYTQHVTKRGDEYVVDNGYVYMSLRRQDDALVMVSNMTFDGGDQYGTLSDVPDRLPILA